MIRECTKERFLEDIKDHKLTIRKDDGLYRHLHLSSGSCNQYYEIITYPDGLMIRGDMGSYTFERLDDMFCFFRDHENEYCSINTGYWAEKVTSESIFGNGVREFCPDSFKENVKSDFEEFFEDVPEDDELRMEVWEEVEDQVLSGEDSEWDLVHRINDFSLPSYIKSDFDFVDFWEHTHMKKTYNYVWCLYAIVWAIRMYDEGKS